MIASQVHAVMAAGLENPALLARWRSEPNLLRKCGVDPEAVDLDALWKFAGLTAKLRHNGLRGDLPLTFRFLNVAGLEIEVFASYASAKAVAGQKYAATSEARCHDLLVFLEQWLDFDEHEHALLWDLIRHEMALAQLRKICLPVAEPTAKEQVQRRPMAKSVPRACGEIVLREMRSDPRMVEQLLQQKRPKLAEVSQVRQYFCYWRRHAEELFILQLDELGYYLLSLVDRKRSLADLSYLINGSRRPTAGLLNAFAELADIGVVAFD